MKNIIKYLGCLALGLLILNKVDFSVYAAEPSKVVRHVEYDEITDVNQLLQMGIEEYQKTPKVRNQSENEEITVKQLFDVAPPSKADDFIRLTIKSHPSIQIVLPTPSSVRFFVTMIFLSIRSFSSATWETIPTSLLP